MRPRAPQDGKHRPRGWLRAWLGRRVRFDRNELAGSFGDIGTDLPLLAAMIPAAGLDTASVFCMFGLMQILTGLAYGLPMPMQPLKAMAVLVITQHLGAEVLYGGGLAIGGAMLALAATGSLERLARLIPHAVVRGIQFGLGLKLASLALGDYVHAMGTAGYVLAALGFALTLALLGNRRLPPALFVIGVGALYAVSFRLEMGTIAEGVGLHLPKVRVPSWEAVASGFFVLALPQLPLSLSNSVIATHRLLRDLFPERRIRVGRIGWTYALANLINPFFGGVPVCHGCGGLAGHYTFGARTGGSAVIYGALYLLIGLFLSGVAHQVVEIFPLPVLGVVLLFEGLALMVLLRDVAQVRSEMFLALLVGALAFALPQGFLVGLAVGLLAHALGARRRAGTARPTTPPPR